MNVGQLKNSQFLKKEDVGAGVLVTISNCTEENVAMPGAAEELKWALHFSELEKPLILNQTNGALIQAITGSPESDDWIGKKIVLYSDATIMFAGRVVGGIRVRAPRNQTVKQPAQRGTSKAPSKVFQGQTTPAPEPEHQSEAPEGDSETPF